MITQEQFDKIELEHGCGYWNLCWEHACPCAITVEHKGLRQDIWNSIVEENKKITEEYDKEWNNGHWDDSGDEEDYKDYTMDDYEEYDSENEQECPFCHIVPTPSGRCGCSNL